SGPADHRRPDARGQGGGRTGRHRHPAQTRPPRRIARLSDATGRYQANCRGITSFRSSTSHAPFPTIQGPNASCGTLRLLIAFRRGAPWPAEAVLTERRVLNRTAETETATDETV